MRRQVRGIDTVVDSALKEVKEHGTAGMPFAVYLNDFASFQTEGICWHWHDELQITLITEGSFCCQVGSEKVMMEPGEVIFFNSRALHQISPCKRGEGKLYSFLWSPVFLSGTTESDLYRNCIAPIMDSHLKYALFGLSHPSNKQLQTRLRRVINIMLDRERYYELTACDQMMKIWMRICEYADSNLQKDAKTITRYLAEEKDEEKVKNALGYILANYGEKITLEAIAKAAMTNRSQLCRCFRRVLDTTPNEFLTRYRLERALELMENHELRVSDIAEQTGFCSPSHFGTHFIKYVGCTPLQYRKTLG